MKASQACFDMIRRFEGFSSFPYRCPAGVPTIGYGSTSYTDGRSVSMTDQQITEKQAAALLLATLTQYEAAVNGNVTVPLSQSQFDALVDFAYNAGAKNLITSTLLKKLNSGDYAGAADQFGKWVFANGKVLAGLVKRREAERKLFLS